MGRSGTSWWNMVKKAKPQDTDFSLKRTNNEGLKNRSIINKGAFESNVVDDEDGELPKQFEAPMARTGQ